MAPVGAQLRVQPDALVERRLLARVELESRQAGGKRGRLGGTRGGSGRASAIDHISAARHRVHILLVGHLVIDPVGVLPVVVVVIVKRERETCGVANGGEWVAREFGLEQRAEEPALLALVEQPDAVNKRAAVGSGVSARRVWFIVY